MKLYEIDNELLAILYADADGEISADVGEKLEQLTLDRTRKIEGILQFRQGLSLERVAIKTEIDRLKMRAAALERKEDWLYQYVLDSMRRLNEGRITTTTFSVTVCKSQPKVELTLPIIPERYQKVITEIVFDKQKVLEDYKAGKELPAEVQVTQGQHLRIT